MVLEALGQGLRKIVSKIASAVVVDDAIVNELIKDLQRTLLRADVNVRLVFDLTNQIKARFKKEKPPAGITKKEQLINIVYESLVHFLGKEAHAITPDASKKPFKIMLVGLFGSGKTTTAAKLAKWFEKRGYKVATLGLDTHRLAAKEQLLQISNQAGIQCFTDIEERNPVKLYKKFEKHISKYDIIIIDTAGRDALSEELITELKTLNRTIKPQERLLVISADIGQAAQTQAEQFHKTCNITGVIATKMDGTARGGGALSACAATGAPIKYIGVGEKIADLESFDPKRFVGRLLGMGDLTALLEKAKESIPEKKAEDLGKKLIEGKFDLMDLYEQMSALKKMGRLSKLLELIPGFSQLQLPKEIIDVQEEKLKLWKCAMDSMTQQELKNPDILDASRIERIAKGSGISAKDIRELIKHYRKSKKLIKMFGGNKRNLAQFIKRLGRGPFHAI